MSGPRTGKASLQQSSLSAPRPFWAFRLGRAGTWIFVCSPDKPMLLISSSHEKQPAIKPIASRDKAFSISMNRNKESSLPVITSVPNISRHGGPA